VLKHSGKKTVIELPVHLWHCLIANLPSINIFNNDNPFHGDLIVNSDRKRLDKHAALLTRRLEANGELH